MVVVKLGKTQLSVRYGYEATVRSGIIKRLAGLTKSGGDTFDKVESMMEIVPELLLVGLQKFHSDQYGYNYKTEEGKDAALSKVYALLDDYFEEDDADFSYLLDTLQNELMENGFLAKVMAKEVKAAKKTEKKEAEES